MTTALIATPSPNDTDAQLQAVAPESSKPTPASLFPKIYIIARAPTTKGEVIRVYRAVRHGEAALSSHQAIYNLETAPPRAFEAWLVATCVELAITEPKIISEIGALNWVRWPLADRWSAIEMLAEYLRQSNRTLPLYESRAEAQAALIAKEAEGSTESVDREASDEQP